MLSALLLASSIFSAPQALPAAYTGFKGVNVAGGDFSHDALPGVLNTDYFFDTDPTLQSMQDYAAAGSNAYRIPFLLERMLPVIGGDLDPTYLAEFKAALAALPATAKIIIDCHNYGRYRGTPIGTPDSTVTDEHFADFWVKLGTELQTCTNCIFGLSNEPYFVDELTPLAYGESWVSSSFNLRPKQAHSLLMQCEKHPSLKPLPLLESVGQIQGAMLIPKLQQMQPWLVSPT